MNRPTPDPGIYICTGCCRFFDGPNGEEECEKHVRRCSRFHGAFFFAITAFIGTLIVLHALGRL